MTETATDQPLGALEIVHLFHGAMPTGVSVSPTRAGSSSTSLKWGDEVPATVVELRDGQEMPPTPTRRGTTPVRRRRRGRVRLGAEHRGGPGRPALGAGHRQPDVPAHEAGRPQAGPDRPGH